MSSLSTKIMIELFVAAVAALVVYFWSSLSERAVRLWNETVRGVGAAAAGAGNGGGGGAFPLTPAPSDLLSPGGKESFVGGATPTDSASATAVVPSTSSPAPGSLTPSDLLPTDGNTLWSTVGAAASSGSGGGGADLTGQIVPAELMDPTRMPHYTSTSKSKIPNQQWWRPDPIVDRSLAASQWFGQAPDTHQDVGAGVPNPNVDITSLRAVPL